MKKVSFIGWAALLVFLIAICVLLLIVPTGKTTGTVYYIDNSATGCGGSGCSDSNTGTSKLTAWVHRPGMNNATGTAGAYSPQPGDEFIFRGGDTWGAASWPARMDNSTNACGSVGVPIIDGGLDKTWFVGSYFTRPIFSGGGTYPGTRTAPSSAMLEYGYCPHWKLQTVEITGFSVTNTGNSGTTTEGMVACNNTSTCVDFEATDVYAHGWSHCTTPLYPPPGGTCNNGTCNIPYCSDGVAVFYINGQNNALSSVHNSVIDGRDVAEPDCSHAVVAGACHSGAAFGGGPGIQYSNYIAGVANAINENITGVVNHHDLAVIDPQCDFDGVTHANVYQNNIGSSGLYFYNVFVPSIGGCNSPFTPELSSGATGYVFNTVMLNQNASNAQGWLLQGVASSSGITWNAFNNTREPGPDGGSITTPIYTLDYAATSATFNLYNTQGITGGSLNNTIGTGGSRTLNTGTTNSVQSQATWNASGYSLSEAFPFSPMTGGSTVHAGTSEASICALISDTTAAAACLLGTTLGPTEVVGEGGYVVGPSAYTPNTRTTWDQGAYQYLGASTSSSKLPASNVIPMMATPPLVPTTGGCPSGTGGSPGYCAVQANDLPWVRGVVIIMRWAQNQVTNGLDLGVESNTVPGSYSFVNLDTVITGYTSQTCGASLPGGGTPCLVGLVDGSASSATVNANTPLYVFDQPWANAAPNPWVANSTYSYGWTVTYGGNYYQAQPASGTCSAGAVPPTTAGACSWTSFGSTAPPQDASFSSSNPGTTNPNWPVSTTANINSATACGGSACTDTLLQAGFPACWETPCLQAKVNWINNVMTHVANAPYASQVVYLRNSLGSGGENFTRNNTQLQLVCNNSSTCLQNAWVQGVSQIAAGTAAGKPANATFVGMTSISGGALGLTNANADSMAANAVANGLSFGAQGMQYSDLTAFAAGTACTDDWCALFKTYNGRTQLFELQTFAQSDPTCSTGTSSTGCLDKLLPLGAFLRFGEPLYLEIYAQDYRCAYETYIDTLCTSGLAPYVTYQQLFQQLFWAGVPTPAGYGVARGSH
jgi:hypothetical protein